MTIANPTCYKLSMSEAVRTALQVAIETKRRELAELEMALRKHDAESTTANGKSKRRRKSTGFKQGSVPSLVQDILKSRGVSMPAAELSDELKKKGKDVDSRVIASSLNRYIGKVFERSTEGFYRLLLSV